VLVLYRPGITPDHPWADRRLVTTVLPTLVIAATAAVAFVVRWARRRAPAWALVAITVAAIASMLVPPAVSVAPLAAAHTETGEPAAVAAVCARLGPGDAVVTVDATADGTGQRSANEWVQVIRGVCDRPAAALLTPIVRLPDAVDRLATLVAARGGRLVLLTAQENDADARRVLTQAAGASTRFGPPQRLVAVTTTEDQKLLTRRPVGVASLVIDVWTRTVTPAG
jgi:hypothetical protein